MNHLVRFIGLFLLVAGLCLILFTVILLNGKPALPLFALLSFAVQALGLTMLFRAHSRG